MIIIRHISDTPAAARGAALAIGNFDGVHRGHQHLIDLAGEYASEEKIPLAALSFEPHPKRYFAPHLPPFRLTPFEDKARLLRQLGVDCFFCLAFGKKLSALSADDFIDKIILTGIKPAAIFVGSDFVFGHARSGNFAKLKHAAMQNNFIVPEIALLLADDGAVISSSRIRDALKSGDCPLATRLLGRPWQVSGHVSPGRALARQLGFPTANIVLRDHQRPAFGVYAVRVSGAGGGVISGVANIGLRPTVEGSDSAAAICEVHLFDWCGDLYGKKLHVDLIEFIRREQKFSNLEELKNQIAADCAIARRMAAK